MSTDLILRDITLFDTLPGFLNNRLKEKKKKKKKGWEGGGGGGGGSDSSISYSPVKYINRLIRDHLV